MWSMIFGIAVFAIGGGLLIGFATAIPWFIYIFPYSCWLGWNSGRNGIPNNTSKGDRSNYAYAMLQAKNATKLYRSWITKKPHNITDF